MAGAGDFCELISQALAGDVFRASLLVTLGRVWHYPGASLSCRMRYLRSLKRIIVHNSPATCRWLLQHATGWHRNDPATGSRQ